MTTLISSETGSGAGPSTGTSPTTSMEAIPVLWRGTWILGAASIILLGIGLYAVSGVPDEETQGIAARLLFVHVPSVVTAYLALGIGVLGALGYLVRRWGWADLVSAAAIEIGVVLTALTLWTGMMWGRLVWSVWWDWTDARMVSTAVLFFLYIGYLALRRSIDDSHIRATRCAVLGTVAFVQVPIVHYSVLWFRTLHQGATLIRPDVANATMDAEYSGPLGLTIVAFITLFALLITLRLHLARTELFITRAARETSTPVGAAVTAPPRSRSPV